MTKSPKDKNQAEADKRRDELAKRVLALPPKPKVAKREAKGEDRAKRKSVRQPSGSSKPR